MKLKKSSSFCTKALIIFINHAVDQNYVDKYTFRRFFSKKASIAAVVTKISKYLHQNLHRHAE
jgi:hypothetical protein